MARNIQKQAEQGREVVRKHPRIDMTVDELFDFVALFDSTIKETENLSAGIYEVVSSAFYMGIAVGNRNK